MSTTHHEAEPQSTVDPTALPAQRSAAEQTTQPTQRTSRRTLVVAVAIVAVLAVAAGAVVAWKMAQPKHTPSDIVALPATVAGLKPATNDPYKAERFTTRVTEAIGTMPYAAAMYGDPQAGRTIRVMAARTDLTKKLDENWAVDAGKETDGVTCTQNVQLVPGGKSAVRPTVMLCWKNSQFLSVYTIIIDPKVTRVTEAEGIAAVNEVWKSVA